MSWLVMMSMQARFVNQPQLQSRRRRRRSRWFLVMTISLIISDVWRKKKSVYWLCISTCCRKIGSCRSISRVPRPDISKTILGSSTVRQEMLMGFRLQSSSTTTLKINNINNTNVKHFGFSLLTTHHPHPTFWDPLAFICSHARWLNQQEDFGSSMRAKAFAIPWLPRTWRSAMAE